LLDKNSNCYRPRRTGERKRKSIRGCIVGPDLSVVNLVVLRKGEKEIEGLTDRVIPRRLGPKRASKIRKLFNLTKADDVRKYVVRREVPSKKEGKKPTTKAPKIQRLVTPRRLQHKRHLEAVKRRRMAKSKAEAAEYARLLSKRKGEKKSATESRKSQRASQRLSQKLSGKEGQAPVASTSSGTDATAEKKAKKETAPKKEKKETAPKKEVAKKSPKEAKKAAPKEKKETAPKKEKKETAPKKEVASKAPKEAKKEVASKPAVSAKKVKPAASPKKSVKK